MPIYGFGPAAPGLLVKLKSDNFSFNHPVITVLQDAGRAIINRGLRAVGVPKGIGLVGETVKDIPDSLEDVLRQLILRKGGSKGNIEEKDWKDYLGTYTGGNRSFWKRINSPSGQVEHTIGLFSYYTDDNGDVHVVDTYDFNVGEGTANNGWYSIARSIAGKVNSKSTDPDFQKRKYDINLGNINTWKLIH